MEPSDSRLSEITFQLMVDSSPGSIVLVSQEGLIAYVNRQCETLFGYTNQELIGKPVEYMIPDRFRHGHVGMRQFFAKAPTLRRMGVGRELFALRKDGTEFPIEIGLNPLVLVDGVWTLATIIDISERKQAERRFRQAVDSAPNAIVLVNQQGVLTMVNRQATSLFGYAESEMVGQAVEMLLPDRVRPGHPALRDSFFANPQTRYMGVGRDLLARRKDGTEIPVEIGLNPIQTEHGIVALASIIDISERRRQEELRSKKEAAEAAYKAKGELLAVASHDLKNPLAAIAGLAEIMLEMKKGDPAASEQDVEFLQSIFDASRHMSEVVQGILETEGLEQQKLEFDDKSVDLGAICEELIRFSEPVARRKNIRVDSSIQPDVAIRGNARRLREAFENYISNAIKYSPPGKTVTVTLATTDDGSEIEFGVRDHGPGLTEDDKAKLFGKFKRLSARPTAGESSTGLGLSIVKAIVELHKGFVGCSSRVGEGAYFWIRLPVG